jgi:hypothetical protein
VLSAARSINRQPAWPEPRRPKEGAPNVLFLVQDDTGFGQMGCYGSPIRTPNIDALAKNGLLFNKMHRTALRSPSFDSRWRYQNPLSSNFLPSGAKHRWLTRSAAYRGPRLLVRHPALAEYRKQSGKRLQVIEISHTSW